MEAYDQAQKIGYFSESAHSNIMYFIQRYISCEKSFENKFWENEIHLKP